MEGLVSGPMKLNAVGTPSSRRGTAALRMEGWNTWAKQKVMLAASRTSSSRSMGISSRTPSASSTSAEPAEDDAARFPCLTILAPAPAHTREAMVEMLTVFCLSPPVPTMSSRSPSIVSGLALASIASTSPVSSSTVSPLERSATRKPATWESVALPVITSPMAQYAWSRSRSPPAIRLERIVGHVGNFCCARIVDTPLGYLRIVESLKC